MNTREAYQSARDILDDLGLSYWTLQFDRAKLRAGACHHGTITISLSEYFVRLNEWDIVRETLLHEAAHALAGPNAGHGWKWKVKCLELGISPDRCYDPKKVAMPQGNIVYECPNHGVLGYGHRMPKRTKICTECREIVKVYKNRVIA